VLPPPHQQCPPPQTPTNVIFVGNGKGGRVKRILKKNKNLTKKQPRCFQSPTNLDLKLER
jgi:hypothetical protein